MRLRVLCLSRRDILKNIGGDTVQILNTIKFLKENYNIDCDIKDSASEDEINKYDIIHFFGIFLVEDIFKYYEISKYKRKKIVVSPIYWNVTEFNKRGRHGLRKFLYNVLSEDFVGKFKKSYSRVANDNNELLVSEKRKEILKNADIILPNSNIEMTNMTNEFNLAIDGPVNYIVVPNAIDELFLNTAIADSEIALIRKSLFGKNIPYVICVANFNPRKNQIRLIKAIKRLGLPLLMVGMDNNTKNNYYLDNIKKMLYNCDYLRIESNKDHRQLISYYKAAKVHALPSWFDTPGLANIEAAACGCNLAVSDRGSQYEYFGDLASYCDPGNTNSIAAAIEIQYYKQNNDELRNLIGRKFLWKHAAKSTYDAYTKII